MTDLSQFGFRPGFDYENRFNLKTYIGDYLVSTVDLGLDHSFGIGEPLYYETMIFRHKNNQIDFSDLYCERYSTEDEARKGHEWVCEHIEEILKGDANE